MCTNPACGPVSYYASHSVISPTEALILLDPTGILEMSTLDQPGHDDQVKHSRIGQQNYWDDAAGSWEFTTACQHAALSDFYGFTNCLVTHQE
ncbi:hypothetical protein HBH56_006680 [Parastagonospora nodorum]|nr:hypothetical protein HBH56_006680 [Parastagonospora nodorum]KAH3938254.1 hypothetical protein HBH54_006670 [Parastagonospora nodorum]KAH3975109.1 hypothetical protein HBH51_089470 [Parastagonospora nodorum]KAH4020142.1 hypothetical protein HBI09_181160 [Parastagonospora nodorum]KAH4053200.1 hypothetical protein HBH49_096540 [Parastagonospora nodorum]